jgi:hypothetical protein
MLRFMDGSLQIAGGVDGIGIREQEPVSPRLSGRGPDRIRLPCPTLFEGLRIKNGHGRQVQRDGAGPVGRAVIHQQQFPIFLQSEMGFRLGQQ